MTDAGVAARHGAALRPWRLRTALRRSGTQWRLLVVVAVVAVLVTSLVASLSLLVTVTEERATRAVLSTATDEQTEVTLTFESLKAPLADVRALATPSVAEVLGVLGMADKADRRPGELSGGEQQRVAIAVALANKPQVLFADEPTGELDSATGEDVFAALRSANTDLGATVVVVTHDDGVSTKVQRTVAIRDGRTASEVVRRTEVDEFGTSSVIAEEYAVLDRVGRLQLPADYRSALGLRDRVRLELEPDHVGVWPDGRPRRPRHNPAAPAKTPGQEGQPR